jgi:hypothetical protein
MGRGLLGTCLLYASVLAIAIPTVVSPPPADALIIPDAVIISVALSITPSTLTAMVTSSQNGPVQFAGNVTVGKTSSTVQRVTVTLSVSCEWSATVSPATMVFTNEVPQGFELHVVVPPKTQVMTKEVTVSAHATDPVQDASASAKCTVAVAQYYGMVVHMDEPMMEISSSSATVEGVLRVNNEGNGRDTFRIEVVDEPDGLDDYDIAESLTIEPWGHMDVRYTLFIEADAGLTERYTAVVNFKITSMGAASVGNPYSQEYSVTIYKPSARDALEEHWSSYAGWGIGLGVLATVAIVLARRRRRSRDAGTSTSRPD